jgi:hypothetical protein
MWILCLLLLLVCTPVSEALTLAWDYPVSLTLTATKAPKASARKARAALAVTTGTFVMQRSLNNGAWQDVATLPLAWGVTTSWTDPALPAPPTPYVVQYRVVAESGGVRSAPSNLVTATAGPGVKLPQSALHVLSVDSEEIVRENGRKENAIDGNTGTLWHTVWSTTPAPPPPHWIILDLGSVMAVDGLSYTPRLTANDTGGTIGQYEVAVSLDAVDWGTPVSAGTWVFPPQAEQIVRFPAKQGRYVRLKALREYLGNPWTSAAEIGIYATAGDAPPPPPPPPPTGVVCTGTLTAPKILAITCTLP